MLSLFVGAFIAYWFFHYLLVVVSINILAWACILLMVGFVITEPQVTALIAY